MKIKFSGAAREVTGSKHLIYTEHGKTILLDCGMYQGKGLETDAMNRKLGFNPASIDYLILSHAHIDHSGLIPYIVKNGFNGTVNFASMKISIIVTKGNDPSYMTQLRSRITNSIPAEYFWELISVEDFNPNGLHQVAEKNEAQLYVRANSSLSQKFEAGAFQATGDIYYFLMPGYLPPMDFGPRIIRACSSQIDFGTIPGFWTRIICSIFPFKAWENFTFRCFEIDNLLISRDLFRLTHGLRWDGKDRNLIELYIHPMAKHYNTQLI